MTQYLEDPEVLFEFLAERALALEERRRNDAFLETVLERVARR